MTTTQSHHHKIHMGEVHSIADPNNGGRCQVRLFKHQDDKGKIPDENLRWAQCLYPVTHAQLPGAGGTHGLMKGSKVAVIFLDEAMQHPMIIGSVGASSDVAANTTTRAVPSAAQ